ncbi:actin organization and endocytosis protein, partial [Ascosphaera atra]
MYLCNLRLTNRPLPDQLPERIANEVSSMVDIISFNVPETPASRQQPPQQQQPSNSALLSTLAPQPTGFPPQQIGMPSQTPFQPQQTGFPSQQTPFQPQPTGMPSQQTPFQPQPTGMPQQQQPQSLLSQSTSFQPSASPLRPQQTSYLQPQQTAFQSSLRPQTTSANIPPIPTQPTGLAPLQSQPTSVPSLQPQPTGFPMQAQPTGVTPLQAQPTGMPGQWGFVNAPATGLPNIEALKQQLMPQPGREGGSFSTQGLSGNATIPWAVTKDEKRIYDDLFSAWDGLGKGFIGGEVAIEIMGQSGLPREDLERIWTLSDPNNRGKLNKDEFAVAMHLIYRRLNGYPVPNRLPPELVPPSTRYLNDSI